MSQKRSSRSIDELIDVMIKNNLANMYSLLMARVIAFYPETMRADVQPLLKMVNLNGVEVENSITTDLPVMYSNSADIYIRTPLVKGDLVLVAYSSVAIDDILNSAVPVKVSSKRKFSQKDGVVLGSYRFNNGPNTLSGDAESVVVHRRSTNTVIKITPAGDIIITGANQINAQCKTASITSSGATDVSASNVSISAQNVAIEATETSISGNLSVGGTANVTGTLTGGKIKTASGKDMDEHTHNYRPGDGAPTATTGPN